MFDFTTKYPLYRVIGDSVSPQLALEILLRTSNYDGSPDSRIKAPLFMFTCPNGLGNRYTPSWVDAEGNFSGEFLQVQNKYPDFEEVLHELTQLAEAFPDLDVQFKFYEKNYPYDVEYKGYAGSFLVRNGQATIVEETPPTQIGDASPAGVTVDDALDYLGW